MKNFLVSTTALLMGALCAGAYGQTANVNVSANVAENCTITANPVAFGARRRRIGALVVTALITVGAAAGFSRLHEFVSDRALPVAAPAPTPLHSVVDRRLVTITLTTPAWTKVREVVTVSALRSDRRLWRQMHVGDWDKIPEAIREPALRNMITAYAPVLAGPRTWRQMTPDDWDAVPQPIRAMAFLRMVWHWSVAV